MKKFLICLIISTSLAVGNVTYAGSWHSGDWAGAALGVAALAVILNQANYYQHPYYDRYPYYKRYPYYRAHYPYYRHYYRHNIHCKWVRGYYDYYGYWIPRHRVCWR